MIEIPADRMEKLGIKGNRLKRIVNILDILYKGKKFVKEMIGGKRWM